MNKTCSYQFFNIFATVYRSCVWSTHLTPSSPKGSASCLFLPVHKYRVIFFSLVFSRYTCKAGRSTEQQQQLPRIHGISLTHKLQQVCMHAKMGLQITADVLASCFSFSLSWVEKRMVRFFLLNNSQSTSEGIKSAKKNFFQQQWTFHMWLNCEENLS